MSKMGSVSAADKVVAVKKYLSGKESHASIAKEYNVSRSTFQKWLSNYQAAGEAGLQHRNRNQRYPETLKKDAVSDYVSGQFGLKEVCEKYQIRSRTQLEQWILLYNGHSKQSDQGCDQEDNAMPSTKKKSAKTKQSHPHHNVNDKRLAELKSENRMLRQKNEDLEMELALRKKVKELKGGGR